MSLPPATAHEIEAAILVLLGCALLSAGIRWLDRRAATPDLSQHVDDDVPNESGTVDLLVDEDDEIAVLCANEFPERKS